jgi:DNA polymerase III delta subunit
MKKNIIHITGNDSYGVELELSRWTNAFIGKFGNINIDRFDLSDTSSLSWIWETIMMSGLFVEKRLFIFRWWRNKKSKAEGLESILKAKIDQIPDEHYLLFHNIEEKEEWLISWLASNADTRYINTLWDKAAWTSRSALEPNLIDLILTTYRDLESHREKWDASHLLGHDIAHTIEMIRLLKETGKKLSKEEVISLCHGYGWDTMFALVDAIMANNTSLSLEIYHRISSISRVDEWFPGLIWLLRNNLYIKYLGSLWMNESTIATMLKIHPFVLKKGYSSKISYETLKKLYKKLVSISIAYKRGKWLKDSELWRILSIDLALLDLQK